MTGSLGLVFAATFARSVSETSQFSLWTLYSVLTALHILANMQCLKLIAFNHLNTCRMNIIVQRFFLAMEKSENRSDIDAIVNLDTPIKIAANEPLYFGTRSGLRRTSSYPIRLGVSFNTIARSSKEDKMSLTHLTRQIEFDQYAISVGDTNSKGRGKSILVAFAAGVDGKVKSKAYLHAVLLRNVLQKDDGAATYFQTVEEKSIMAETTAAAKIECLWNVFAESACQAGWDLESTDLQSDGYELSFK